jgi:hypothetical protein
MQILLAISIEIVDKVPNNCEEGLNGEGPRWLGVFFYRLRAILLFLLVYYSAYI